MKIFRFGKRSEVSAADQKQSDIEAFMRLQGADDSVSRLSRPRYLKKTPNPNFDRYRIMIAPPSGMK